MLNFLSNSESFFLSLCSVIAVESGGVQFESEVILCLKKTVLHGGKELRIFVTSVVLSRSGQLFSYSYS